MTYLWCEGGGWGGGGFIVCTLYRTTYSRGAVTVEMLTVWAYDF